MNFPKTAGERLCDEAWRAGDHRPRCDAAGHLICRGCQSCACDEGGTTLGRGLSTKVRVTTDSHGATWCQECRYEVTEYGNYRSGDGQDDRPYAYAWRMHRQHQRSNRPQRRPR